MYPLLDEAALAALERPEHQVVLFAVEADGEVIAVRFEVEQNAGALIELPGDDLETNADVAIVKIVNVFGDRIRKIGKRFHVVDDLLGARAVDGARLCRQSGGRLAFDPLPPVDLQHGIAGLIFAIGPIADDGKEMGRGDREYRREKK